MNKLLHLFLAATIALSLVACGTDAPIEGTTDGGGTTASDGTTAPNETTAPAETSDSEKTVEPSKAVEYPITLEGGTTIVINSEAKATLDKLGAHIDYMEAPSCVHEGSDKIYTYDGYTVTVSPNGKGGEFVAEFSLTSDVVALDNGIYVGCTVAEIKKAYGEDYNESFGVIKYEKPGASISVIADGDTVTGITFSAAS